MEAVIYYAETDGIALERMVRKGNFNMRVKHFHNQYEIFFLIEGERQFFFNNRAHAAHSGSLILVDENIIHMTKDNSSSQFGHDRIILYIDREKMQEMEHKFPHFNLGYFFHKNYGVFHLTQEQQLAFINLYIRLQTEFDGRQKNYKAVIDMEIMMYFIMFMRENHTLVSEDLNALENPKYQHVYHAADYISKHYTQTITLDMLAAKFFISKYYLCRTFKEITGYSINEYVNIHRIQRAKKLLEETDLGVSEIARQMGYESITYFEKVFKNYMTISPLKYRKTLNTVTYTNFPDKTPHCRDTDNNSNGGF